MESTPVSSVFDEVNQEYYPEPVSLGRRFTNYIIDSIAYLISYYLLLFIIGLLLGFAGKTQEDVVELFSDRLLMSLLGLVTYVGAYTVMEGATRGRSPGKVITGTIAVKEDLSRVTWKDAFLRSLCRMVPFEPVSMFADHPWHDKWTGTTVVKRKAASM